MVRCAGGPCVVFVLVVVIVAPGGLDRVGPKLGFYFGRVHLELDCGGQRIRFLEALCREGMVAAVQVGGTTCCIDLCA